jgi:hypothetical protein
MAIQLQSLFSKFGLMHCEIASMKDKGNNLTTMTFALCSIVDYEPLRPMKVHVLVM